MDVQTAPTSPFVPGFFSVVTQLRDLRVGAAKVFSLLRRNDCPGKTLPTCFSFYELESECLASAPIESANSR